MIRKHYLEIVPKEDADAWFSIVPPAPEKVIQFPRQVPGAPLESQGGSR
jgi:hypothetical protein